ncbi:MAG: hypothetical protein ACFFCX_08220 [Candidatus Sifarchaeia archaeon]
MELTEMILPPFQTADKIHRIMWKTGTPTLDSLLDGGFETGLVYLFYGSDCLQNNLLRAAVHAQLPLVSGGFSSSTIIIDSSNMVDLVRLRDFSFQLELEPENVLNRIYISRAFNSTQTYDLVINHLDEFLERIPAKFLILSGLVDLFINEGLDVERMRQMTHIAARINAFTLRHDLVTLISTQIKSNHSRYPPVGKTLASSAQVHIHVDATPMRTVYSLTKHPSLPNRKESLVKMGSAFGVTLPLDYFFRDDSSI